jgi:hypothetical protein
MAKSSVIFNLGECIYVKHTSRPQIKVGRYSLFLKLTELRLLSNRFFVFLRQDDSNRYGIHSFDELFLSRLAFVRPNRSWISIIINTNFISRIESTFISCQHTKSKTDLQTAINGGNVTQLSTIDVDPKASSNTYIHTYIPSPKNH